MVDSLAAGGSTPRRDATARPWRLFIALPVPAETQQHLHALLAPYRQRHGNARWLDTASWHVTLLFLGAVAPARSDEVIALIGEVAAEGTPFTVTTAGGGGHLGRRGSVAWLGIAQGAGQVIAAADALRTRCPDDLTLGPPPRRAAAAHLTIARRVDDAILRALGGAAHGPLESSWTVDRIVLFRSLLSPQGSRYELVHDAPLSGTDRLPGGSAQG